MKTKKEQQMFENYITSKSTYLNDVYGTYSNAKEKAYEWCRKDMIAHNGEHPRIPTSNRMQFTYAFQYKADNGKTRMRYHTASNVYDFEIW